MVNSYIILSEIYFGKSCGGRDTECCLTEHWFTIIIIISYYKFEEEKYAYKFLYCMHEHFCINIYEPSQTTLN